MFTYLQKSQIAQANDDNDPTPIEFYRLTHTNKDAKMSAEAEEAYVSKLTYLFLEQNYSMFITQLTRWMKSYYGLPWCKKK